MEVFFMALSECAKYSRRKIYGVFDGYHVLCHNLSFDDCIGFVMDQTPSSEIFVIFDSLTLHGWVLSHNSAGDTIQLGEVNIAPLVSSIISFF